MEKEGTSKQSKEKDEKTSEKKGGKSGSEPKENLEEMMLNTLTNKYDTIVLARRWIYELRSKDTESHSIQDLIATAVGDVLSGRVSQKTIQGLPTLNLARKQKTSPTSILDNIGKAASDSSGESGKEKPSGKSGKKEKS